MRISPSNIIEGLIKQIELNQAEINKLIKVYSKNSSLHLFKGMRKTLPESSFPSLEFEPTSGSMEWSHTSAMTGEYSIDCVLTVSTRNNNELGLEYICELTRKIVEIFNLPQNMTWVVPNEWQDKNKRHPVLCQYSSVQSAEYGSTKDLGIRVARWTVTCRCLETFPEVIGIGPVKPDFRKDVVPGTTEWNNTLNRYLDKTAAIQQNRGKI